MKQNKTLHKIRMSWRLRLVLKSIAWMVLLLLSSFLLTRLFDLSFLVIGIGALISAGLAFLELRRSPKDSDVVKLVNEQFESSQYSTELVFQDVVSGLNALQREKVLDALNKKIPSFKYPILWKDLLITATLLLVMITIGWLNLGKSRGIPTNSELEETSPVLHEEEQYDSVFLRRTTILVSPPAYTGLKKTTSTVRDVKVPAQSQMKWKLEFEGTPSSVWMMINEGDSLPAVKHADTWEFNLKPSANTLYTLNFEDDENNVFSTPYHELQLIQDELPVVEITGIPQFQRLDYNPALEINMNIQLSDDYGLTDGYLVATITKGSGESVKFREQNIPFKRKVKEDQFTTRLTLKPADFDMEPGNELYFYAVAADNHEPNKQQARTETYFFILKDTSQVEFSLQGALGIDLMPDYFRSQLQLIIDTEKLVKEKDQMTEYEHNFESNALGYDQKQLRLKYGQFIGEEEDSGLEVETETEPEMIDDSGENVLDEFGHNTDKENEEGQWMDRGTEHDHEPSPDPEAEEDPLEDFMHDHDDEETATFYTVSLKSKLRAALNEMWDSELYLRLYQPEKSLPYQYKAQELLKEIRNHARIYVQRIGFDPPPVNEAEARLTGKMKELNERSFSENFEKEPDYPFIRNAISELDQLFYSGNWNEKLKKSLKAAGDELAGLAIEHPGQYLEALNTLRQLLSTDTLRLEDGARILSVKRAMEAALPDPIPVPISPNRTDGEMIRMFIENLITSRNP
ncbi:MAG: hypothetical protein RIM99_11920 [Cyclobacteriaceae bacterium]